mgnify:CR=1 FL=1
MDKKEEVLNYIKYVLEVPRDEYNGMPTCPFAKKEREGDNLYIDYMGEGNDFITCMEKFYESGKDNAIFINDVEMPNTDTKRYQHFLNKELLKNAYINHKALCINPKDDLEVDGFNARSLAPCFMVLINNQKEINQAHKKIMKTSYFDKMSEKYKKYLGL